MGALRRLPRNVWLLSVASFLRDVASETLVHLVPLYLTNVLSAKTLVVGLIDGVAETTASLMKLLSGWLSDRSPRRKPFVVAGYGLAALATPLLLVASSWPLVLAFRFVDRLGKGIRTAPRDALLADALDAKRRGMGFGLHRAADSAGAFVGLLLAIALVWMHQGGATKLTAETFQAAVWAALIPSVLAVAVIAFGVRESARRTVTRAPNADGAEAASAVKADHAGAPVELDSSADAGLRGLGAAFWGVLAAVVLFTLGNSSDAFLILRAQAAGMTLLQVLGAVALFNLVYTLVSTPAGALSDRVPRRAIVVGGWLLYALVYAGFASAGPASLWLLFAAYGVYYAFTEGVLKALVADVVPADRRGAAYGLFHAAVGVVALPASLIAGFLWQGAGAWPGWGPAAPFWFGAALALAATVVLLATGRLAAAPADQPSASV